jgi:predicted small lipoprotein YifL
MRRLVPLGLILCLAACGQKGELTPPAGKQLPVAPYGREERPTAEQLLKAPTQAAPERSVELRKRSEEREDDPFDLPPKE